MRTQKEAEQLLAKTDKQPWIKKLQRAATLASIDNKLEEDICFGAFKKRITERIENKDSASFIEIFIPVYALFTHLLESNLTDEQFYAVISVEEVRKREYEKLQKYLDLLSTNYNKKVTLDINEVLNTFEDWLTHKERTELYVKVTLELTQFGSYKEFLHFATWIRLSWEHNNNAPYAYPFLTKILFELDMVEYFKNKLNLLAWICLKCGCSNLRTEHGLFSRGISIPVCSDKNVIESISKNGIIFKSTIISIDEDDLKKMNVEDRLKALQKLEKKEKAIQSELMSYLNERYGSDKSFPNLCSEIHESKQSAITKIKGIAGIILNS